MKKHKTLLEGDVNFLVAKIFLSVLTRNLFLDFFDQQRSFLDPCLHGNLIEVAGTVGDIESLPFLEAIRQFSLEAGSNMSLFVHLTLLPYIDVTKEIKTKPTQHSVKELRSIGIQPDILLCRGKNEIDSRIKKKLALFTNVSKDAVFSAIDAETIYDIPVLLQKQNIDTYIT